MFVNIRCRSEYDFGASILKVRDLVVHAAALGMEAVGVIDQNLHAVPELVRHCERVGITPVVGCEVRIRRDDDAGAVADRLALIAVNGEGYRNLCRLATESCRHEDDPRQGLAWDEVESHAAGLVALGGGARSEVGRLLLEGEEDRAILAAMRLKYCFAAGAYLELGADGGAREDDLNALLRGVAAGQGLPLVVTSRCAYLLPEHRATCEALSWFGGSGTDAAKAECGPDARRHFKTEEEIVLRFGQDEPAVGNSGVIAQGCSLSLDWGTFPVPRGLGGREEHEALELACSRGLERYFAARGRPADVGAYWSRLEDELRVVRELRAVEYFLVLADIARFARERNIPLGPGRGYAGGVLLNLALGITEVDPIAFGLDAEWCLNPQYSRCPDIDFEICPRRRGEVYDYLAERYGAGHVGLLSRFERVTGRDAVAAGAGALGHAPEVCREFARAVGPDPRSRWNSPLIWVREALKREYSGPVDVEAALEHAERLAGLALGRGVHEEGLVLSSRPVQRWMPCWWHGDAPVGQFDGERGWDLGRVWFDFHSLEALTVIERCVETVARSRAVLVDWDETPMDDPEVFGVFAGADTTGIQWCEDVAVRRALTRMRPETLLDVAGVISLGRRPSAVECGMLAEFAEGKHDPHRHDGGFPALEACFADTYGVPVFIEQLGRAARDVAGYPASEVPALRRALMMRIHEQTREHKSRFMKGAASRGHSEEGATWLFDRLDVVCVHLGSKADAVASAVLAYRSAYLKRYYRDEFLEALSGE